MLCPYCLKREALTADHIFPAAIGGKRTIAACAACNNGFGNSFEGRVINGDLLPILVLLKLHGVDIAVQNARWNNATQLAGHDYSLEIRSGTLRHDSGGITVRRDPSDQKRSFAVVADGDAARKKARRNFAGMKITDEKLVGGKADFTYQARWGADLARTALKISYALLASEEPRLVPQLGASRREFLFRTKNAPCALANYDLHLYFDLAALRPPLAHFVYICQEGMALIAVVQLFGCIQIKCQLGTCFGGLSGTICGSLDVKTGEERIWRTPNVNLSKNSDE